MAETEHQDELIHKQQQAIEKEVREKFNSCQISEFIIILIFLDTRYVCFDIRRVANVTASWRISE
jgi:hypothetical protein